YFAGNNGSLGDTVRGLSNDSTSARGYSLHLAANGGSTFGGFFTNLFARSQVDTGPNSTAVVPNFSLDLGDIYGGVLPLANRRVEQLAFDIKHSMSAPLSIRVELKTATDAIAFQTQKVIPNTGGNWQTVFVDLPANISKVQTLAVVVEDNDN